MIVVIGKIAAALSQSAGHTVEVYKAEESTPNFRVFITTTEEGDHAVVMLRGSKVTVIPLFKESPEKLIWHSEILPTSAAIRPCMICMGMKAAFLLWSWVESTFPLVFRSKRRAREFLCTFATKERFGGFAGSGPGVKMLPRASVVPCNA